MTNLSQRLGAAVAAIGLFAISFAALVMVPQDPAFAAPAALQLA